MDNDEAGSWREAERQETEQKAVYKNIHDDMQFHLFMLEFSRLRSKYGLNKLMAGIRSHTFYTEKE
jgi:hypothetical protein